MSATAGLLIARQARYELHPQPFGKSATRGRKKLSTAAMDLQ
jgi:hypothetical protein